MSKQLETEGFLLSTITIPKEIEQIVDDKNWSTLDELMFKLTSPEGVIFQEMAKYCPVKSIEFIISLRDSENEWEEDGIWHDDGSRILAFSLSLTKKTPKGGILEFRKKNQQQCFEIETPKWGQMIIFKTGTSGYEHRIRKVDEGQRLIIAGWCT